MDVQIYETFWSNYYLVRENAMTIIENSGKFQQIWSQTDVETLL